MSYLKKDWGAPARQSLLGYDNKDLKVCFLMTRVIHILKECAMNGEDIRVNYSYPLDETLHLVDLNVVQIGKSLQ